MIFRISGNNKIKSDLRRVIRRNDFNLTLRQQRHCTAVVRITVIGIHKHIFCWGTAEIVYRNRGGDSLAFHVFIVIWTKLYVACGHCKIRQIENVIHWHKISAPAVVTLHHGKVAGTGDLVHILSAGRSKRITIACVKCASINQRGSGVGVVGILPKALDTHLILIINGKYVHTPANGGHIEEVTRTRSRRINGARQVGIVARPARKGNVRSGDGFGAFHCPIKFPLDRISFHLPCIKGVRFQNDIIDCVF